LSAGDTIIVTTTVYHVQQFIAIKSTVHYCQYCTLL